MLKCVRRWIKVKCLCLFMVLQVHGPPGSGKTTTARLLVSEKNLDLVFSGTTGTASALYKAETVNSLLHLGRNVEDFKPSSKRLSAQKKSEILSKFGDARILVLDEVSMCNPVMFALIDLRLRQCFDPQKSFGGLHVILLGDMYQFPPIGRKLKNLLCIKLLYYVLAIGSSQI